MASQANLKSHDFYEVLAVASNATQTEINKAYRKLAHKHHPDKNLTRKEDAEEEFKCIVQAYAVLSDPEQRKRFDQLGQRFLQPSFQVPEDWEERQEVAKAKAKAEREVRDIRTKAAAQVALERKEKMQAKLAEDQARKQEKKALQKAKEEEQKIRSRNSMAKQTARSMQRQSMSAKAKKSKPEAPDPLSEASEPKPGNQAEGPPAAFTEATNAEAALPVQVVAEPFGLGDAIPDQKDFWQEFMEACWSRLACCGARRH